MKILGNASLIKLFNLIKEKFNGLAKVATSGSYNDLKNRPTIPTVGNGTITIKQAGASKGTFTTNQTGNTTIELTDSNTWRGIQNNLTSDSTTDSLSAAQGKKLKGLVDEKAPSTHTHNYAGSSSAGGSATSAVKLQTPRKIALGGCVTSTATSFDGSSDIIIPVTSTKPEKISDGYTRNNFYLNTHPENNGAIIPFINNDIAYLTKRGGSVVVKYDGVVQSVDISDVFNGSPSYWYVNDSNVSTIVIELTLHRVFTWRNTVYIDFGSISWGARDIKLEVMNTNYSGDVWTQKGAVTNHPYAQYKVMFYHTPVGADSYAGGFNKIRITLSNFRNSTKRIAAIGIIYYNSYGMRETFLPKDGGSLYGGITPFTNNKFDLGSSSNRWANIYSTTFTENGTPLSSKYAAKSHTHSVTAAGTNSSTSITPAGTISQPTFTGTAHNHTFTGKSVTSGKPDTTNVTTIYSITGVGSLPTHTYTAPSLTGSVENQCLTITFSAGKHTFSAGSLPTSSAISMPTTNHTHAVTAAGTIENTTAGGTVSQPTFKGTAASHTHTFTGSSVTSAAES